MGRKRKNNANAGIDKTIWHTKLESETIVDAIVYDQVEDITTNVHFILSGRIPTYNLAKKIESETQYKLLKVTDYAIVKKLYGIPKTTWDAEKIDLTKENKNG